MNKIDRSICFEDLVQSDYKGVWTLNDHGSFRLQSESYSFVDSELLVYQFSTALDWLRLMSHKGDFGGGSVFFVMQECDGKWDVMINRRYDSKIWGVQKRALLGFIMMGFGFYLNRR